MEKAHEFIESLNKDELTELKRKLEGGVLIRPIENKLERFKNLDKVCPVCNTSVGDEGLTLIFGPSDFKQKATFDGTDCLEYFLARIRK